WLPAEPVQNLPSRGVRQGGEGPVKFLHDPNYITKELYKSTSAEHVQYGTFARGRGGRMQARLLNTAPEKAEADALILPIFEGQTLPPEAVALDKKLKGALTQLLADREFRGRFMELVPVHNLGNAPSKWTVLVGLGKPGELDLVRLRNALQAAGRVLRKRAHRRAAAPLPH